MEKRIAPGQTQVRASGQTEKPEVARDELRLVHRILSDMPPSHRGREIDSRLHSAWIEWEMASPAKKTFEPHSGQEHYGDGQQLYCETVRKGVGRQHRRLGEKVKQ